MKSIFLFLIVAPIIFIEVRFYIKRKNLRQIGIKTKAKLIGYEKKNDGEDYIWYIMVEYLDLKGKTVNQKINSGASWKMYSLGAELDIIYNPEQPENMIICNTDIGLIIFYAVWVVFLIYFLSR